MNSLRGGAKQTAVKKHLSNMSRNLLHYLPFAVPDIQFTSSHMKSEPFTRRDLEGQKHCCGLSRRAPLTLATTG